MPESATKEKAGKSIVVEWLGHCAFRIIGSDGIRILIDPFDDSIGYKIPPYDCDILVVTHGHYDTSAIAFVPKGYRLIDAKGTTLENGIAFNGFPCWHDNSQGKDFGQVLVFTFEIDGIRIAYLSHIGSIPKNWVLEKLMNPDVCFIPVGGVFTIGPADAHYLIDLIKPKIVIPMHFETKALSFSLLPLSEFTKKMPEKTEINNWRTEISREMIPKETTVLLMRHWSNSK